MLKLPERFQHNGKHRVLRNDIFNIVTTNEYDLAYFDPPYGSNNEKMPPSRVRYAAIYGRRLSNTTSLMSLAKSIAELIAKT